MIRFLILCLLTTYSFAATRDIVLTEKNSISFNQAFSNTYVAKKQLELLKKHISLPSGKPIFIVLDTPGGSVSAGLSLIDTIKSLNRNVHTITLFAASMGYQLVQESGIRYITPSGQLMSHRGSVSGLSGQVPGELNSRLEMIQKTLQGMNERAAKRVNMSVENYQQLIINEYWVSGNEAVNKKHADFVANVTCENSLIKETYKEDFLTPFGSIKVEFSKCPLLTIPVSATFGSNMNPLQKSMALKFFNSKRRRIALEM